MTDPDVPHGTEPDEAADNAWPRGSVKRLAAALGLDRRTIYKLIERNAPDQPDEQAWRGWCKRHGVRVRPSVTAGLDDLGGGKIGAGKACGAQTPPAVTPTPEPDAEGDSAAETLARQRTLLVIEQTAVANMERLKLERELVSRDDVRKALRAFGLVVVADLTDLPMLIVRGLGDEIGGEQRRVIRKAAEAAIERYRAGLVADLRNRVAVLLGEEAFKQQEKP